MAGTPKLTNWENHSYMNCIGKDEPYVMISYQHDSSDAVEKIEEQVSKRYKTWFDKEHMGMCRDVV